MRDISVILSDIRSAENVGSIFRTADAAGVSRIYLAGYTPAPTDRFGRPNPKIAKAALGAEKSVPWESHPAALSLVAELKKKGVTVIAVEQHQNSVPYQTWRCPESAALILGNEVDGVPAEILNACDSIIEIPMRGAKESLNVSVAAGIALFHARDY
jgi:tRNA G18 (ribose-2'-O)-methylase SpoU